MRSEEERVLWRQFTHAREADSWREFDLILIAKMVRLEADIRKHNAMIDQTSVIIENKRGTMVENPLLRVVDTLTRQQLSLIRSLSLGVHSDTARDANSSGSKARDAVDTGKIKDGKILDLLAR